MAKPKTQAQLDQATDMRLQKQYGKSLEWYEEKFEEQGGCAVCGDQPGTRRLNVDHDHTYTKVKIATEKDLATGLWMIEADYRNQHFGTMNKNRNLGIQEMKLTLKSASVRGLLCHRCNRAMILFRDRVDLLDKAIGYLVDFQLPQHEEEWCDGWDGTGLMEGWNHRDGHPCPKCKGAAKI